jgi:uncharacterized protein YbaA (DUF1428 family)
LFATPAGKNGYVLPQAKLDQREAALVIYRDMGSRRSLNALVKEMKANHPEIAASQAVVFKWSKQHNWAERAAAHDQSMSAGRVQGVVLDSNFDQVDALLRAANQALTRAMSASPVVTRPGDVKALVDAAANALKLIETIKNQSSVYPEVRSIFWRGPGRRRGRV